MAYRSSNGESPVQACGTSLYASKTADKYMSQSLGFSCHISFSIILRTSFILSQSPIHFGFYRNVNNCLRDISLQTSIVRSEVNWLPLSPSISVENKPLRLHETKLQQLSLFQSWAAQLHQCTLQHGLLPSRYICFLCLVPSRYGISF